VAVSRGIARNRRGLAVGGRRSKGVSVSAFRRTRHQRSFGLTLLAGSSLIREADEGALVDEEGCEEKHKRAEGDDEICDEDAHSCANGKKT